MINLINRILGFFALRTIPIEYEHIEYEHNVNVPKIEKQTTDYYWENRYNW
jgi:hypothetical protein